MPGREEDTHRNVYYGGHPPNCTCVDCVNRRLGILKERSTPRPRKRKVSSYHHTASKSAMVKRNWSSFWGKLKRLLVLLAVLATTAIVVVTVCRFVANELKLSSLLTFLAIGLFILVWGLNSISKYRLSFSRMFMVLLISSLFLIVSSVYLGIRSPQDVKDSITRALSTETGQFRTSVDLVIQRTELKLVEIGSTAQETVKEKTEEIENTKHVHIGRAILVGADGHYITLRNNPQATNTSWKELNDFLLQDNTDNKRYNLATFVCADFAEMLHNNAEAAGIKAAFVSVRLGPCPSFPRSGGHAFNAFETTDKGLVYIDCTSSNQGINADKIVAVKLGKEYIPRSIFPEPGWEATWVNIGVVEEIKVIEW